MMPDITSERFARPGQKLNDHLKEVAKYIRKSAKGEGEQDYFLVGLLHDLGKYSKKFQKKIQGSENVKSNFRHPIAALPLVDFILEKNKINEKDKSLFSFVIYFHHNIISFDQLQSDIISIIQSSKDSDSKEKFVVDEDDARLALKELNSLFKEFDLNWHFSFDDFYEYLKKPGKGKSYEELYFSSLENILRAFYKEYLEIDSSLKRKFSRVYSLLVEADWLSIEKAKPPNFDKLHETMEEKYRELSSRNQNPQNVYRKSINEKVMSSKENRLFLVAPTGVGKSEISLLWALKKAKDNGAERVIYVLPFNALIDDLYKRFSTYLGSENITFWNSEFIYDKKLDSISFDKFEDFTFYRLEREYFFNSPIIITTADQILMSFLNLKRYPIRRGIFEKSVFVFDEIQGYDDKIRSLLYSFMNNLSESVPILLMTATPPLDVQINSINSDDYINLLAQIGQDLNFKMIYNKEWFDFHKNMDCKISIEYVDAKKSEDTSPKIKELVKQANLRHKSIAVIVNKVEDAVKLYKELKEELADDKIVLLHSRMLKKDKEERFNLLHDYLTNGQKFILVSTQVIEAGVDLSFDYMIRVVAPIPSLIQSLGRVNRRGQQPDSEFTIILLDNLNSNHNSGEEKEDSSSGSNKKSKQDSNKYNKKYQPYSVDEMKFTTRFIKSQKNLNSKVNFERIFLEEKTFSDASIKRWEESLMSFSYLSDITDKMIWSIGNIKEILGEDLREQEDQIRIFIKDGKEDNKLDEDYYKELRELKGDEFRQKLKEYIEFLRSSNNYIVDYRREEINKKINEKNEIKLEDYKKIYLGEE
jgi:CRISPR-associated endonuclease/helicase Cas3